MKATHRRAIGMTITLIFMLVYSFFAAAVGGLFAEKNWAIKMGYFAIAGMAWVFPLYPLYAWMRKPDPGEALQEKPPAAAALRKRKS